MSNDPKKTPRLDDFEPARRESLRKIFNGAVYTAPVVASFSLGGLGGDAQAQSSNQGVSPGLGLGLGLGQAAPIPATTGFGIAAMMGAIGAAGALLIRRLRRR